MPAGMFQHFWHCSTWIEETFRSLSVLRTMNSADLLSKEPGVESRHLSKELLSSRPYRVHFI